MPGLSSCSDPLYPRVVSFAEERGEVSTAMVQRTFFIGYNRARMLIEAMESRGLLEVQALEKGYLRKFVGTHNAYRCEDCRSVGMLHCANPETCGGMKKA